MTTKETQPLRIINLQAENIKRLVAVDITPDSALVQITGRNGSGKTSVLDAIWWTVGGSSNIQGQPIRKGEDTAKVRLDMGELVITRKFTRKDGNKFTTSITVENADGAQFRSPQTMIDDLIGSLSLDPLEFARMRPKEQFEALRQFVPEIDFQAEQVEYRELYDQRRDHNREAKRELAAAESMNDASDNDYTNEICPVGFSNVSALIDKVAEAGEHNAGIDRRVERRAEAARQLAEYENDIAAHKSTLEQLEKARTDLDEKIKTAPDLPEKIDVSDLREKISIAERDNQIVEDFKTHHAIVDRACAAYKKSEKVEAKITKWQETRDAKLKAAKLPVDGLSFFDSEVYLDGIPFNQASDAQQLQVSVAMAMAASPTLRLIRIRDGSLLDTDAMKLLEKMAEKDGYQIWVERVDTSGKVGFIIEDGSVKEPAAKKKAAKPKKEGK